MERIRGDKIHVAPQQLAELAPQPRKFKHTDMGGGLKLDQQIHIASNPCFPTSNRTEQDRPLFMRFMAQSGTDIGDSIGGSN